MVLTCADSRVPPEYIFNEGLGALFVVRVAGGVADPVTVGSVEYGVEHLHPPLVDVMGHTRCGAVKAALETPAPSVPAAGPGANLESILSLIRPGIPRSKAGEIGVIGAVYEIETGRVAFSEMVFTGQLAWKTPLRVATARSRHLSER